ncbi:MAG TPA: hypothetical protein VMP68_20160 [Candidatus Eisenbacteria bacterium]|nr:hypothetical protein [Candidatus Eisenbacteria bacterium]
MTHVADHDKAVTLARLFEDGEESVPCSRGTKERQSPPTGTGDKVQMICAVRAMQTRRHNKAIVSAASFPPLQRTQGRGTHGFETESRGVSEGGATRQFIYRFSVKITNHTLSFQLS